MRIFVAGATGAIGSPLVEALVRRGHQVTGTTRSAARARGLEAAGAEPAILDALDREAVKAAVARAEPDVVVHELTSIPAEFNPRRFEQAFAQTNRLRTEGTDHLIAAARTAPTRSAPPPRRVPVWLGRIFAGRLGVTMMTGLRGASNAKAKQAFGWELRYPSWRQGFRDGL